MTPGGPAAKSKLIETGDVVLEINKTPPGVLAASLATLTAEVEVVLTPSTAVDPDIRMTRLLAPALGQAAAAAVCTTHDVILVKLDDPTAAADATAGGGDTGSADDATPTSVGYRFSECELYAGTPDGAGSLVGAFITMHAQLKLDITNAAPVSTQLRVGRSTVDVLYRVLPGLSDPGEPFLLLVIADHAIVPGHMLAGAVDDALTALATVHGSATAAMLESARRPRVDGFWATFFRRYRPGDAGSPRGAPLASRGGLCKLACSDDQKVELFDVLEMVETAEANVLLHRPEACLATGCCLLVHGFEVYSNLQPAAVAAVTSVAAGQGLVEATVDGSVPFTIYWTEVLGFGAAVPEGATPAATATGARPQFVLLAAMQHTILAVLLEGWHSSGRSELGRTQGPDQSHIYHAYLKLHMLHVNGTIGRIIKNLTRDSSRMAPMPSRSPIYISPLHERAASEESRSPGLPQRPSRAQSVPLAAARTLPDGLRGRAASMKGR